MVGDSQCYGVGLIPIQPPSVSCLQQRPASGFPQWSVDMTLRLELHCCEQTDWESFRASGLCDRLKEQVNCATIKLSLLSVILNSLNLW